MLGIFDLTGEPSNPEKESDGISARGGLAAGQSTGLFGASERYALAHKLLTQFSPYFKSHHPYKQKRAQPQGSCSFCW